MDRIKKHVGFALINKVIPNNLDIFTYVFNIIIYSLLVFYTFNGKLYDTVRNHAIFSGTVVSCFSNNDFEKILIVLPIVLLLIQSMSIMPMKDVAFFKAVGFKKNEIRILIIIRMLPFLLINTMALILKRHSVLITIYLNAIIILAMILLCITFDKKNLFTKKHYGIILEKLLFKNKWLVFIHSEITSNKGLTYFTIILLIISTVAFSIGYFTNSNLSFFIITILLLHGYIEDIFFDKLFKNNLYFFTGVSKSKYLEYCCFFACGIYMVLNACFLAGAIMSQNYSFSSSFITWLLFCIYGILFVSSHIALRLLLYKTHLQSVFVIYAFAVFLPLIPIIVIIIAAINIKKNDLFIEG